MKESKTVSLSAAPLTITGGLEEGEREKQMQFLSPT